VSDKQVRNFKTSAFGLKYRKTQTNKTFKRFEIDKFGELSSPDLWMLLGKA